MIATERDLLFRDPEVARSTVAEYERGLKLHSRGSRELLRHPTPTGWEWFAAAFCRASLPLPSFLGCGGDADGPKQGQKRHLEEWAGQDRSAQTGSRLMEKGSPAPMGSWKWQG